VSHKHTEQSIQPGTNEPDNHASPPAIRYTLTMFTDKYSVVIVEVWSFLPFVHYDVRRANGIRPTACGLFVLGRYRDSTFLCTATTVHVAMLNSITPAWLIATT
jgi:hypothetical protein